MSWLFSRALVEEYLGDTSLDGEPSAPLSGNPTQQAYCAPDKMTAFSRLSRFGMTFKPLTENLGEELLTLYLGDFHAKTSQLPEKEMDLMESEAECGEKWRASFTKYDPDSSSWKTHQCSLQGDLDEFSETWPQWGLMRDGECWEQQTLEQTIRGTEFGLSEKWATPTTMDRLPPKSQQALLKEATFARLGRMQNWPTPTAHNAKETNAPSEYTRNTPSLTATVMMRKWGTPKVQDSRHALRDRGKGNLGEQVSGLHNGGKLNPTWTEWLMGWPLEWTDLKPLETDKSLSVQQQLGEF